MTTHSDYVATFDPKEYLKNFYVEPDPEDRFVIRFMVNALQKMSSNLQILELGGGPTLFAVATLAPKAHQIHFCDYVPANLKEVQRWLDNNDNAFNWHPYIEMVLEEEGKLVTPQAVEERAAEMRKKVTWLTNCNAAAPEPLGQNVEKKYNLVVAQASTDVAANTVKEWMQIISNISNTLLSPGGWLLISVITGTSGYTVGQERFHCLHLTNDDIYQGYMAAGFNPDTFQLETMSTSGDREYFGISTAVAQKSAAT